MLPSETGARAAGTPALTAGASVDADAGICGATEMVGGWGTTGEGCRSRRAIRACA